MSSIIDSLQEHLRLRRIQRAVDKSTRPEMIMALTVELRDLVIRAAQHCSPEIGVAARFKLLETELSRLEQLANRPEFCNLSPEQRLEVRQGLMQVRNQVLNTMQENQPPTDFIQ